MKASEPMGPAYRHLAKGSIPKCWKLEDQKPLSGGLGSWAPLRDPEHGHWSCCSALPPPPALDGQDTAASSGEWGAPELGWMGRKA